MTEAQQTASGRGEQRAREEAERWAFSVEAFADIAFV